MINYKSTLNLPKTNFPMKANLTVMETNLLKCWYKDNLYHIIRKSKLGKKKFLLCDGPPYANGNIHIGHGLNKILKDIILKSKSLSGFDTPFIPGWDCHGLPIEHKVEQILGNNIQQTNHSYFLDKCRKYAFNQIENQKKDFIRLGILGDWDNPYLTMDFKSEANIVRSLAKIINSGHLYKGIKPVHWCFDCRSALAEAEVEYYDKESPAVYVSFQAVNNFEMYKKFGINNKLNSPIYLLVWTTTPWTIPANCAIALNKKYKYQLIKTKEKYLIIERNLVKIVMNNIGIINWQTLGSICGMDFQNTYFIHPFLSVYVPAIMSKHVDIDTGTGIVHIAPGHGPDDYLLGQEYNLKTINLIDAKGFFKNDICPELNGMNISQINDFVISMLNKKKSLIYYSKIKHSYPHCWRHKTPVIFRTTSQWFISMEKKNLRSQALKLVDDVLWFPKWGINRIKSMLYNRPDWCISRQRRWGVPMTLFIHKKNETLHPNTLNIIEKIAQKIEKQGIQAWWDLDKKTFLGNDYKDYNKVLDTLDVWFDSGSVHDAIMGIHPDFSQNKCADLCIEGTDQHRGWFMSSLLISTAIRNKAPYKQVLTHGFTVDCNGKKMSKSLLNIVNPRDIANKFGADIFRLWIASNDYTNEIVLSDTTFKRSSEIYRRIRNTMRFLLANLNDFDPKFDLIKKEDMILIDKWVIGNTKKTQESIINAYNNYNFHDVVQILINFCSIDMGSFYLDIIKDRQYTNKTKSVSRRSCQTAIWFIAESLVRWISPILSFTADEIWKFLPGDKKSQYIFTEEWFNKLFDLEEKEITNNTFWNLILSIRNEVNFVIEKAREDKIVKNSLEAEITLYVDRYLLDKLKILGKELKFIFLVSKVEISDLNLAINIKSNCTLKGLQIDIRKSQGVKCPRCWHYVYNEITNLENICKRCIINTIGLGEIRKFV